LYNGTKGIVTSHPSVEADIKTQGWEYSQERVVVDEEKKLITSRGYVTTVISHTAVGGPTP
jgi:protein DJ-1